MHTNYNRISKLWRHQHKTNKMSLGFDFIGITYRRALQQMSITLPSARKLPLSRNLVTSRWTVVLFGISRNSNKRFRYQAMSALLMNTQCSHLHSLWVTEVTSILAVRVTLDPCVTRGGWESLLHVGWSCFWFHFSTPLISLLCFTWYTLYTRVLGTEWQI